MGSYAHAADFYDLLYDTIKDYAAESARLVAILRGASGPVRRVLDVGCGTGRHAALLHEAGFAVDGVDLEPAFVRIAQARNPAGRFAVGDMMALDVDEPYDAVLCLFGAIGYALTEDRLRDTAASLARAVRPGGLVVVEPWLEPADMKDGYVTMHSASTDDLVVSRVSRTLVMGAISRLEFEYLVARPEGISRLSEVHELGLFPRATMAAALEQAGLRVTRDDHGLTGRGLYVASRA